MEKIPIYQSNQKIEDSEKIDLAAEAISLMDLSSQNDNQLSGVLGSEKEVNTTLEIDVDHTPQLLQSTDHEKARRNGRCNLRKSLAWDSAFFSNAGVLDPEELSTMIKVAEKDKNQLLPGIKEEIRRSIDSISSLESDNFTVESLEDDLFVDIRASIQRSNKKVHNATNYISKSAAMEIDNQAISTLKKESIASQKKLLVKPGLKNTSRQTIRMPKCQPKQNIGKQESGKAVKQDSGHSQVTQTVTKTDEPSSLRPKPPKAVSRATLTSTSATKRDSTGSSRVKSEIGSSKLRPVTSSTKGSQASKVPCGARRALPKPAASSNSSSLGTSTTSKMLSTRSSTSSDSFDSMLSKTTANSPLMSARRIPVKSSTIRQASSDSIPKTPSKAALQNKPPPATLSAYLRSTKISSSVSPASSISEWSSASSSSTVYQRSSNSRNSLDISSCPSIDDSVVPLGLRSTDGIADEYKSKGTALPGNISNKSIAQSGTLQAPAKLSGLRKPSPKIGFFDAAKSIRTPNGTLRIQSDLGNVLMKIGAAVCSPKGSSNIKPKTGKFPTSRAVSSLANVKPGSPKSRSPASFPERSRALTNDSQALSGVKDSPSLSPEAQGNRSGENILKLQKVQAKVPDGNKKVLDAGTGAVMNENPDELIEEAAFNMHRNIRREDIEAVLVEDNNAMGSKSIGQRVDKDVLDDENHWKCLSSILKTTEDKQELSGSKEYVNSNVYSQKGEPLSDISDSVSVSFPETASTTTASRAPFDLKDSFYNSECPDFSKESADQLVEKIVISLPITEQKENI
ncbi:Hypothetical predicted protein [Olea europaea subsp. europaea]|uniref:Uncharacterized protein n=1 Tax=Olea europaea subsp. europaea TaxID=158383 RepID=A0A8S0TST3_OLEEU|nr:Hypothetical predicted protein [Olea europaea subsp. europaea]